MAARIVAERLGLHIGLPSAFQGRIGGAKGVWMVDLTNDWNGTDDIWIEITDSQLKFQGHKQDENFPDPHRVTFDVHSWSKPLKPESLNFQLIHVLENRGVDPGVFNRMLVEDLNDKTAGLQTAMSSGLELRLWNQENNATTAHRVADGEVEWRGGVPNPKAEQINTLVEVSKDNPV